MRCLFFFLLIVTILSCNSKIENTPKQVRKDSVYFKSKYNAMLSFDLWVRLNDSIDNRWDMIESLILENYAFLNRRFDTNVFLTDSTQLLSHREMDILFLVNLKNTGFSTKFEDFYTVLRTKKIEFHPEGYHGNDEIKWVITGDLISLIHKTEAK